MMLMLVAMEASDLFSLIELLATILVPVLLWLIGFLSRQYKVLQTRVDELEDARMERRYTLYGVDEDPHSKGLAEEVVNVREDVSEIHHDLRYLTKLIKQMDGIDQDPSDDLRTFEEDD